MRVLGPLEPCIHAGSSVVGTGGTPLFMRVLGLLEPTIGAGFVSR